MPEETLQEWILRQRHELHQRERVSEVQRDVNATMRSILDEARKQEHMVIFNTDNFPVGELTLYEGIVAVAASVNKGVLPEMRVERWPESRGDKFMVILTPHKPAVPSPTPVKKADFPTSIDGLEVT